MKKILLAAAVAVALPGCDGSDHDDESPLAPLFFWAYLFGGARSVADDREPVAVLEGSAPDAVTELRWVNETTGAWGVAEGTSSWTARVPVAPGVNAVTVTAWDVAGRRGSSTRSVRVDGASAYLLP